MLGQFISPEQYASLLDDGHRRAAPLLELEAGMFDKYNREPFLVSHRLAEHPDFSLERLLALCRRLPSRQVLFRVADIPGDVELDTSYDRYKRDLTLDDVIDHFEERQAYICINNPERDPAYRPIIEGLLAELAAQVDPLDPGMTWYSTYVFISAHDATTPYHMDREMNFLLQIRGGKTVYLWNPADADVMTDAQKDYLLAYVGSRPPYKPSIEPKAAVFQLRPGLGVHHPFIAPHRVHTGSELSISLAVTFRTRRSDTWTRAHQFNTRLRRIGLRPGPVGRVAWVDRAKATVTRAWRRARRALPGQKRD
ncbi:transcription factor jumonji JmjC domain-containing protein [Rhodanobacter sp. B05]|jgi:hypothetical protein|uniref:cupin-like domain-containing protein n=1 Tax=Rhodanobacter sp. B05 TaxID=1945859 RepID=UPI0009862E4B|nr:cupin-like domain-containing protein [Rhodanobacter sp. B05]OOG53853.1 transcription factor jumonji JmjC domain-containing protein [Rhodanobacter sp. B05]